MSSSTRNSAHPFKRFKRTESPLQPIGQARFPNALTTHGRKRDEIEGLVNYEIKGKSITNLADRMVENSDGVERERLVNDRLNEIRICQDSMHKQLQEAIETFHIVDKQWREHPQRSNDADDEATSVFKGFCNTVLHTVDDAHSERIAQAETALEQAKLRIQQLEAEITSSVVASRNADRAVQTGQETVDRLTKRLKDALDDVESHRSTRELQDTKIADQTVRIEDLEEVIRNLIEKRAIAAKDHSIMTEKLRGKDDDMAELEEQLRVAEQNRVSADFRTKGVQAKLQDEIRQQQIEIATLKSNRDQCVSDHRKEIDQNLTIHRENETKLRQKKDDEQRDMQEKEAKQFLKELDTVVGLRSDGCWETLSRFGLPITPTKLDHKALSSGLLPHTSKIYERGPVLMTDAGDISRSILKVMLALERGAVPAWEGQLWDLWCTIEEPNGLATSTREEVFTPLLNMAERVIHKQTSALATWLASRLASSLISRLPATQPSPPELASMLPEAGSLILPEWEELAEESEQRQRSGLEVRVDTQTYFCFCGSERVEVRMVSLPGPELMVIVIRGDKRYFVWHDLQSSCSVFAAELIFWIRLGWSKTGVAEFLRVSDECVKQWSWLVEKGFLVTEVPSDFRF